MLCTSGPSVYVYPHPPERCVLTNKTKLRTKRAISLYTYISLLLPIVSRRHRAIARHTLRRSHLLIARHTVATCTHAIRRAKCWPTTHIYKTEMPPNHVYSKYKCMLCVYVCRVESAHRISAIVGTGDRWWLFVMRRLVAREQRCVNQIHIHVYLYFYTSIL